MTRLKDLTELGQLLELIAESGIDAMATVFTTHINIAMRLEREGVLRASPYERSAPRTGHANG